MDGLGLSPRVRGILLGELDALLFRGSIPARAGEPRDRVLYLVLRRVYPRACGGTRTVAPPPNIPYGLSPRVRGNPALARPLSRLQRSIPARAGEPRFLVAQKPPPRVYPRACGGTSVAQGCQSVIAGLSPRVRGNRLIRKGCLVRPGSIPARAGEPARHAPAAPGRPVYPRACGGTPWWALAAAALTGLSPRVRGNLRRVHPGAHGRGSIPARAGEPTSSVASSTGSSVYPRACGGTFTMPLTAPPRNGLSPRVRGNRPGVPERLGCQRSIPARAGEPRGTAPPARARPVYPRACGGTPVWTASCPCPPGLSPRVRGNRRALVDARVAGGSIPARAGEPRSTSSIPSGRRVYPRACGGT